MNHEETIGTHTVERYSLDEMTSDEREAFEQHYFECNECWADVRRAEIFAQNARLVRLERKTEADKDNVRPFPLRAMRWMVPVAAALLMVIGLGPVRMALNSLPKEGEMPHLYLAEQMRGEDSSGNTLPAKKPVTLLVDILPAEGAASYRLELLGPGRPRHLDVSAEKVKENTNTVQWFLRPLPPGNHELVIQSVDSGGRRSEIARYPIQVGGGS